MYLDSARIGDVQGNEAETILVLLFKLLQEVCVRRHSCSCHHAASGIFEDLQQVEQRSGTLAPKSNVVYKRQYTTYLLYIFQADSPICACDYPDSVAFVEQGML